jgi:predicted metal-binding protein
MDARYDIRLSKAYLIANNDAEWFASDVQHIEDTIQTAPGEWKENPTDGVAIMNYLNSSGQEKEIARKIIIELQKDLYQCNNPEVSYGQDGKLTINPNATL